MASITFSGQLDQAMNEAAAEGNKILFIPQQTVGEVLPGAASELAVESDGSYSITLAYNTYSIYHYSDVTKKKTLIANSIVVSADTAVSTIPDLIGSTVPVTEDSVLTIQGYLTEAQGYADSASDNAEYIEGIVDDGHNALTGRSETDAHPASAISTESGSTVQSFISSIKKDTANTDEFGGVDGEDVTTAINEAITSVDGSNKFTIVKNNNSTYSDTNEETQDVKELILNSNYSSYILEQEGRSDSPSDNIDTTKVVRKVTNAEKYGNPYDHMVGAFLGEVIKKGSGDGENPNNATWIALAGNSRQESTNTGTDESQSWDAQGNTVGVAGFASSDSPFGITTALWGYASSPTMTDTEFDNSPNFTTAGLEVNLNINHKDAGFKTIVSGTGTSVGAYVFNYRTPSTGVRNWSFGIAFNGNPDDNDYTNTDISEWNGFHVGILLDKIKNNGIRFGTYQASGSVGIEWPSSFADDNENVTSWKMGRTKASLGQFFGSTFYEYDFWHNGGNIYFRYGGASKRVIMYDPSQGAAVTNSTISPGVDDTHNVGTPSFRFSQVYASNGTINTSDERQKQQVSDIEDKLLDAWANVNWCQFKWNSAVEEKGDDARFHIGLIAQKVKSCIEDAGLDPFGYGLLCYDEWEDQHKEHPAVIKHHDPVIERVKTGVDSNGNDIYEEKILKEGWDEVEREAYSELVKPAGNSYALRYEQCLAIEAAYQRREIEKIKDALGI